MQILKKNKLTEKHENMLFPDMGADCINKLQTYDHRRSLGYIMNHN